MLPIAKPPADRPCGGNPTAAAGRETTARSRRLTAPSPRRCSLTLVLLSWRRSGWRRSGRRRSSSAMSSPSVVAGIGVEAIGNAVLHDCASGALAAEASGTANLTILDDDVAISPAPPRLSRKRSVNPTDGMVRHATLPSEAAPLCGEVAAARAAPLCGAKLRQPPGEDAPGG
jgi:hypothetical protein